MLKIKGLAKQSTISATLKKQYSKSSGKKVIGYISKQGELLKKFKDTWNFFDNVGLRKSTIYFKIFLYKFLKKYSLLETSTLQSSYFKNNSKAIKVVYKENPTLFE